LKSEARTAERYELRGKPAVLIPGRCRVIYEPAPRQVPWTEVIRHGKRISEQQFRMLLCTQD
jgi:hypothetical protein